MYPAINKFLSLQLLVDEFVYMYSKLIKHIECLMNDHESCDEGQKEVVIFYYSNALE